MFRIMILILFYSLITHDSEAQTRELLTGKTPIQQLDDWVCYESRFYMQKPVSIAFDTMRQAALKDGIILNIVSAYRSFSKQKAMWEQRLNASGSKDTITRQQVQQVMAYCAMPGLSRHHWGTELDVSLKKTNGTHSEYDPRIYNWLVKNASKYGFYQPYTSERKHGSAEEKWHWSYRPIAEKYCKMYFEMIDLKTIYEFKGDQYVTEVDLKSWTRP